MSENSVVCRTCRMPSTERPDVGHLPVEAEDQTGKSVAEKIYEVSDVMVRLDTSLPQFICMPCMELLDISYNFRQQIIESNNILTSGKLGPMEIKQEPMDPCEIKLEPQEPMFDNAMNEANPDDNRPQSSSKRPPRTPSPPDLPPKISRKQISTGKNATARKYLVNIAQENVEEINGRFHCRIDEFNQCNYAPKTFDACNLIRHFRKQHREVAKAKGLFKESGEDEKVPRTPEKKHTPAKPAKPKFALNDHKVITACLKLVTEHNFPVDCFDWAGFRILLDPIGQWINLRISSDLIKEFVTLAANKIVERITKEMSRRMVSIKLDSGCLRERHVLTVSAQFELHDVVARRTLSTIEVEPNETSEQIRCKLQDLFCRYNLSTEQIYAISWDEGPTIITSNRKLRKMASSSIQSDPIGNKDEESDETNKIVVTQLDQLESLAMELKNEKFITVRGAIHNLEQALGDIVDQADPNVATIEEFVASLRKDKFRTFVESQQVKLPPLWSSEQWISKYKTIHSIVKQEWFFATLKRGVMELDLKSTNWQFMKEHEAAFLPLYKMIKQMQQTHQPFSEFYMQWLIAIKDLRRLTANRFSKPVTDALTTLLGSFKQNNVFNAALYLDPRFNYFKSAVFTPEQREEIQSYIIDVWNRIDALTSHGPSNVPEKPKSATDEDDDMDRFLTEMFGGQVDTPKQVLVDANCPLMQQLKGLEIEPRQPHNYDVWKHWIERKDTHSELAKVALVVLSVPTNSISLPTTFGAFFAPEHYPDKLLEDIITVKLNQATFNKILPLLIDCKK